MKLLILTPLLLLMIASCSNDNNQADSGLQSDPLSPEGSGLDPAPETESESAVITMDNHVGIVANVLAIFSGKLYGDELLTAPDYSDPAFDSWPEIDSNTAELITQPADRVCSNGGTLTVTPETQGFFIDNLLTWNFDFDNCQDGQSLFDGQLSRGIYEAIHLASTGFERDDQTEVLRYSGSLVGRSGSGRYWTTTDMDFSIESSASAFVIEDSNTTFFPDALSGDFKVRADWTDNQTVTVRITGELVPGDDSGELELGAGPDNILVLNADTGNSDTVDVTITADGITSTVTQPWALWSDNLLFESVSGY